MVHPISNGSPSLISSLRSLSIQTVPCKLPAGNSNGVGSSVPPLVLPGALGLSPPVVGLLLALVPLSDKSLTSTPPEEVPKACAWLVIIPFASSAPGFNSRVKLILILCPGINRPLVPSNKLVGKLAFKFGVSSAVEAVISAASLILT